eukprot:5542447-Heterocapsa_arctica.AAC.1
MSAIGFVHGRSWRAGGTGRRSDASVARSRGNRLLDCAHGPALEWPGAGRLNGAPSQSSVGQLL